MPGTPSVEELCERLAQRNVLIEALSAELGAARVRIAELEARGGADVEELLEAAELGRFGQAGTEVAAPPWCPQARWAGRPSRVNVGAGRDAG